MPGLMVLPLILDMGWVRRNGAEIRARNLAMRGCNSKVGSYCVLRDAASPLLRMTNSVKPTHFGHGEERASSERLEPRKTPPHPRAATPFAISASKAFTAAAGPSGCAQIPALTARKSAPAW